MQTILAQAHAPRHASRRGHCQLGGLEALSSRARSFHQRSALSSDSALKLVSPDPEEPKRALQRSERRRSGHDVRDDGAADDASEREGGHRRQGEVRAGGKVTS